jgi:hypothetical protein
MKSKKKNSNRSHIKINVVKAMECKQKMRDNFLKGMKK